MALDEPALGDITGVSGGLERAQVLLVGSRSEVVHDADERVLVVDVLGSAAQLADQSLDALVRGDDIGVDVGDTSAETVDGIGFVIFAFKVTLLAAESQGAQEGKTTDGDERDSDGSSGNSGTAETSVRDGSLDGAEESTDATRFALESSRVLRVFKSLQVRVLLDSLSLNGGSFPVSEDLLGDGHQRWFAIHGLGVAAERGAARRSDHHH